MSRRERLILITILAVGALLRIWGLTFGLPHPEARPDETIVVITALGLLFAGLNPKFFVWPALEFYVVAAIYRIGWEIGHLRGLYRLKFDMFKAAAVNASPYIMVPRVLAVASGLTTIWLVFKLTDKLIDRLTALTAAFFLAVAFVHVRESHFGVTDVPMTAMVVGAVLSLTRVIDDPMRIRRWIAAGVCCGLAASTKYNGGLVLGAGIATAGALLTHAPADRRTAIVRGSAVLVIATLVAFLCASPYVLIDWPHFYDALRSQFNVLDTGHGMVLERGWVHHLKFSWWYGLGPPVLIAGLLGIPLLIRSSWRNAVVICTFPLLFYVVVGRGHSVFVRYSVPVAPFLCITAAFALVWTIRHFASAASAPKVVALAAIAMAIPSLARAIAFDRVISQTDTRVLAQQWIAQHVGAHEQVGQIPPVLIYPDFGVTRPDNLVTFDVNQKAFVSSSGTASPDWIVVPVSPLGVYTVGPDEVGTIATTDYVREVTIPATRQPEPASWFDQQDQFFVPFANFSLRERPGPEIQIYRRRSSTVSH